MKKNKMEIVGLVVVINGKEKTFPLKDCWFQGWEWSDSESGYCDSGVDVTIRDGKKSYRCTI